MATSIFNYRSPDAVLIDMIDVFTALQPDVSVNEASTLYFLFQVFAVVSSQNLDLAQQFAEAIFLGAAQGDDLTNLASDRGIDRKASFPAEAVLTFSRVTTGSTITINASSSFGTPIDVNGAFVAFKTFTTTTIASTALSATGLAQATEGGALTNVAEETITRFITSVSGVDTVTNAASAYGGYDEEDDETLRERTREYIANAAGRVTALGYQQFLESLVGVETAYVFSASASMPNYITAVVTTSTNATKIPTAEQLATWETEINKDENRAVVDVIDVIAPSTITVGVTANIIEYDSEADPTSTRAQIVTDLIDYINSTEPNSSVRLVDISNIIHDNDGVLDFTISAPVANTAIGVTEKAIVTAADILIT